MPAPATRTSSCGRKTRRASWPCAARRPASCTSRRRAAAAMAAGCSSRCSRLPCPRNRSRAGRSRRLRRGPRSPVRAASRRRLRSAARLAAAAVACIVALACASAPRPGTAAASRDSPTDAGATSADAGVALDPEARKGSRGGAIARVGPAAAELLYLEAVCKGILARTRGFTQLVEERREIIESLERVAQLAPDLDDAGAERELGRLYAALPSSSGGDLAEARRHLEAAVERAPRSVRNRIAYATSIAVKAQDRALFESQLHAALEADPDDAEARELLS